MLSRTMQLIAHTCSNGIGGCCLGDAIANLEVMDGIEYAAMTLSSSEE